jgi:hypothetical protein
VLEGGLADSAFLAGIAETAIQDPNYIKSLFTADGNGVYTVQIPDLFGSSYVQVDERLPSDGTAAVANATTGNWAALLEKAAAQNAANSASHVGSYASLSNGGDDTLSLFSGQMFSQTTIASIENDSFRLNSLVYPRQVFENGNDVILQSGNDFYAVTGISSDGTVGIYNPKDGSSSNLTLSQLTDDTIYFGVSQRAWTGPQ